MTRARGARRPRVLLVDDEGCVLLFRIVDDVDTKPPLWITVGGGVELGEDLADTAARELREETGTSVGASDLGAPIAVCRGDWEFRGVPLSSEDWFFAWRTTRFTPSLDGLTDLERDVTESWRWWSTAELDATDEWIVPGGLADLVRRIAADDLPDQPVELPWNAP